MKHSVPIIFLLLTNSPAILSLDPLSWGMVAGAGVFTSFLYSSYDQIKVRYVEVHRRVHTEYKYVYISLTGHFSYFQCVGGFSECCSPDWVVNNFTQLEGTNDK